MIFDYRGWKHQVPDAYSREKFFFRYTEYTYRTYNFFDTESSMLWHVLGMPADSENYKCSVSYVRDLQCNLELL